jgi:hypothetical protein
MTKRLYKPKLFVAKNKVPAPYRSWLEYNLHKGVLKALKHEGFTATYDIIKKNRKYTPDFVSGSRLLEAKGRFRDRAEAEKYIHIKNSGYTVCFIFQNPKTPLAWAQKRKRCGTKMSHAEWAEKNGFEWCSMNKIPSAWTKV